MEHEKPDKPDVHGKRRKAKPSKEFYHRNLPHIQKSGRPIFVTFRTYRRIILPETVRTQVLQHCLYDNGRRIHVYCAVVMPDHVHMLFTLLEDDDGTAFSLEEITNGIKGASAHTVNRQLRRKGCLWQDESFDHVLRSDQSVEAKSQYICDNPIRKGLVSEQDDYPWLWREWVEGEADTQNDSAQEERD